MSGATPKADGGSFARVQRLLDGSDRLSTPDVTRIQALALGQAFIAVLVVLGIDVAEDVEQTIIALSIVLGAVLPISDAAVRRSRAGNATAIAAARRELEAGSRTESPTTARAYRELQQAELELAEAAPIAVRRQTSGR